MVKHKPKVLTNVKVNDKIYKVNRKTGILELPERMEQFNPIEEPKKKKVKKED